MNIVYYLMMLHDSKTPRERRHDANLLRILDTALEMVASGGFDALSMTKLAAAADYTPGALYRYFASKDEILAHLVTRILEDLAGRLAEAEARLAAPASPLARVFALVLAFRTFAAEEPHRFGLLAMTMAEPRVLLADPAVAEPVVRAMIASLSPMAMALGDAAMVGALAPGDPQERTICMFALLQGALQLQKQSRHAPALLDVQRISESGARSLLIGWGGAPTAVDAAMATANLYLSIGAPT